MSRDWLGGFLRPSGAIANTMASRGTTGAEFPNAAIPHFTDFLMSRCITLCQSLAS
jgi:hypothetical protein